MLRKSLIALALFTSTQFVYAGPGASLNLSQNVCNSYQGLIPSLGFTSYWRFSDPSPPFASDLLGVTQGFYYNSIIRHLPGPLVMPSESILLDGSASFVPTFSAYQAPNVFSFVMWFKTSTTNGGKIIGYGDGIISSSNYDRHIYMTNNGNILFGVYDGNVTTLSSSLTYNDNNWHMVAASMGPSGMLLSIDGSDVSTNSVTTGQNYTGYLHIGYDNIGSWPNQPSSNYFGGSIAEVAVSVTQALTLSQMQQLFGIGTSCGIFVPPVAAVKLTGAPQTVANGLCSGAISASVNVTSASPQTLNLSGSGLSFYSDSDCNNSISNLSIAARSTSSAPFYFLPSSTGPLTVTAAMSGYVPGTQTENITTNPFVWTGGSGTPGWGVGANWSGGNPPNSSAVALFDGTCVSNCSPTIDSAIDVGGVRMASNYSGTITQGNFSSTIETDWVQLSGNYIGATGFNTTMNRDLRVRGGSYKASSGTLQVGGSVTFANSTFTNNSCLFNVPNGPVAHTYDVANNVFNNVHLDLSYGGQADIVNTWAIDGDFNVDGSNFFPKLNSGTVNVKGNISFLGYALNGGSGLVRAIGVNQTISGNGSFPNLEVASSGTTTLSGTVAVTDGFTYTSGTISAAGSTLKFGGCYLNSGYITFNPGNQIYNNVSVDGSYCSAISLSGTLNVAGNLALTSGNYGPYLNGGTIQVSKDVSIGGTIQSSSNLIFVGSGVQNFSAVYSNNVPTGTLTVNNLSSQVVLTSDVTANNTPFVLAAGSIYLSGYSLYTSSLSLNSNTVHTQDTSTSGSAGTLYVGGSPVANGSAYGGTVGP